MKTYAPMEMNNLSEPVSALAPLDAASRDAGGQ